MSAKPVIIGFGELLWDLLPAGDQLGGAPGNFAYHSHVLGAEVHIVSAIGDDALGHRAIDQLRATGLGTHFISTLPTHPTGTVHITLNAGSQPSYNIVENAAWDMIQSSQDQLALASRADAVCFGSLVQRSPISRATLRHFLAATRPDCLRIFDINLRSPHFTTEVVLESLATTTLFKLNDEELPQLAAMLNSAPDEASVFKHLFTRYPLQTIALTRGAQGATLVTRDERHDLPGQPPAKLADTVGAGDSFTAALVTSLLAGRSLEDAGTRAIRHASHVCSQHGAMPDMSSFLENEA